jgi:hypothetical protein
VKPGRPIFEERCAEKLQSASIDQLGLVGSSVKASMGRYVPPKHRFKMKKSVRDGSGDGGVDWGVNGFANGCSTAEASKSIEALTIQAQSQAARQNKNSTSEKARKGKLQITYSCWH